LTSPNGCDLLIKALRSIPAQESWIDFSAGRLRALESPSRAVGLFFDALTAEQRNALFDGSHDTATHYKWLVHRNTKPRFVIWLHEYKSPTERAIGYAQVPHDHRYNIVSLILNGGYIANTWDKKTTQVLRETSRQRYTQGSVMTLDHNIIHSLVHIYPHTMTLVIEGPALRGYSTAYYENGKEWRIFSDFPTRWPDFRIKLDR